MPETSSEPGSPADDLDRATEVLAQGRKRLVQQLLERIRIQIVEREALLAKLKEDLKTRDTFIDKLAAERNALKVSLTDAAVTVAQLQTKIEELREENTAMMVPSHNYGVMVRLNPEDDTADVFHDGLRHRVGIHPSVKIESLICGATVVLNGRSRTVQQVIDDGELIGPQVTVTELLDGGRTALVEDARGERRIVLVGQGVPADSLEPSSSVVMHESVIVRGVSQGSLGNSLGSGSRFLLAEMPDVTFDDIGGMDEEIAQLVASLENPYRVAEGYQALKLKETMSALFVGLPGNGKTMLAMAIARRQFDMHREKILKYAKGNFFAVGGTELYAKWLGDTEGYLRSIIAAAQKLYVLTGAISTVFFDDCDAFFLSRSAGLSTNINGSVNTQFSTLVDGIRKLRGVNLLGATNRLDLMDLAVVRRFDRQLRIKPPDTPERAAAVLHKHLREIPMSGCTTDEAVNLLVADMFAKSRDNELLEIFYRKDSGEEDNEIITLSQLISGKFLADIVEHAKERAIERGSKMPEDQRVWALTTEDLMQSLISELRNKESLPGSEATVADWLMQKGDKRIVDSVITLRDRRKRDAKHDRRIDDRVV